jgi:predicted ferric reductase
MDNQKALRFAMQVVAVILGITLFKQFDFETMRFAHWPMAIVYLIGFGSGALLSVPRQGQGRSALSGG